MKKIINKHKTVKVKFLNYIQQNGKKQVSEKIVMQSFKLLQKSQKKPHKEIIKLAIQNSTPMFRMVSLKNNRRRKKLINEIPVFVSNDIFRTSWSMKFLTKPQQSRTDDIYYVQLKNELLLNAQEKGAAVLLKNELQSKVFQKKRYLKFYRW